MKICVLADAVDHQYAGVYVYACNIIKALLEIDKENEYWFIHSKKNDFFNGLNEVIVPASGFKGAILFKKFIKLPKIINKINPDIVWELEHIAPWIFSTIKARKIVTIYDLTPVVFKEYHTFIGWFIQTMLFPRLFKRSDGFFAISECTNKDIEKVYSPKMPITVTYLASRFCRDKLDSMENENFKLKYKDSFPYILYVGTIEPRKNINILIEAFDKLKKDKQIPHKLVLVGKQGWKIGEIMKRIESSLYKNDIILLGYADLFELPYFYNNAECLVYPSLYEGFGLPPLEAMSLGCPVIVSNTSSLPEVVGDAGILCNPNSVGEWSSAIYNILTNQELREGLVNKGLERSQKFNWEESARKTLDFFKQING